MVLIKARLYGGPWDGRMVRIDVEDAQNPPEFGEVGHPRRDPKSAVCLHIYRRAARDPWNSGVWDYVAEASEDSVVGHEQSSGDPFMTRRR